MRLSQIFALKAQQLRFAYSAIRHPWRDVPTRFVLTTGRCGSTFLAPFFHDHFRGVWAEHETMRNLQQVGVDFVSGQSTGKATAWRWRIQRAKYREDMIRAGCDMYLETNPYLAWLAPLFSEVYDNFRVLHIVRNGHSWLRSIHDKEAIAKGNSRVFMGDDDVQRVNAEMFANDPLQAKWKELSRVERLTWYWNKKNSHILDLFENDDRYLRVRFEDLFRAGENHDELRAIMQHFQIEDRLQGSIDSLSDAFSTSSNEQKKKTLAPFSEWDVSDQEKFNAQAGDLMKKFGYA